MNNEAKRQFLVMLKVCLRVLIPFDVKLGKPVFSRLDGLSL